jgi:hypothetical protein
VTTMAAGASGVRGILLTAKTAHAGAATCSQLTKAEIQPLLADPITKVTVKAPTDAQYTLGSAKKVGQQCTYAVASTDSALAVTVIGGPVAAKAYAADVQGLGGKPVKVSGVGDKAVRAHVDANGAVGTSQFTSLKGNTYCSVEPQADEIPGVSQLEEAAGATADIGDKAHSEIAAALGTVCNRVYGSGHTKPDLSGLTAAAAAAPTTTTSDVLGP